MLETVLSNFAPHYRSKPNKTQKNIYLLFYSNKEYKNTHQNLFIIFHKEINRFPISILSYMTTALLSASLVVDRFN